MTPIFGFFRRWEDMGKPSQAAGIAALALGLISLVPLVAPIAAILASVASLAGVFLSSRYPERFAGRRKIVIGLCLCALGMGLFFLEADLFMRWKIRQAYEERIAISRFRLAAISEGLELYREQNGTYPSVSGIMTLKDVLEPRYAPACPVEDAFGHVFSATSEAGGYALTFMPEPPPNAPDARPEPVVVRGAFQPAPEPPPSQAQQEGDGQEDAGAASSTPPASKESPSVAPNDKPVQPAAAQAARP